ncbi:hypothetical protein HHI36_023433 [Cryptolaemus montrouzieri]|uniref:Uncharacterized protein n=1 Tax=Cryptolaemus montrouzieri TaxID=559131 RepID=A0ABD2PH13_9CUCU
MDVLVQWKDNSKNVVLVNELRICDGDSSSDNTQLPSANYNRCPSDNPLPATGIDRCPAYLMDGAEREGNNLPRKINKQKIAKKYINQSCIQISYEDGVDIFNYYYGLGDLTRQREYLLRHIKRKKLNEKLLENRNHA